MALKTEEAMLWKSRDGDVVECSLCAHRCVLKDGQYGRCSVRRNIGGTLQTMTRHCVIAMNADPIEKKPLFHFLPGSRSLSIATPGCNFRCQFCQNWQISQTDGQNPIWQQGKDIAPAELVALAERHGCASISYTYTEPTVFFELAYDTARAAKQQGIRNCFVSNGYMTPEAVETIAPYLDAINVDLKAFREETYRTVLGATLAPVLQCLRSLVEQGVWVEVTTLVVPDMNDTPEELGQIAEFIATSLGRDVPWHISRFHGDYDMTDSPATSLEALMRATELAKEHGLRHVYCGNVSGQVDENTYCPDCGERVIERMGFSVRSVGLRDGACPSCGQAIAGVWA